MLIKKRKKHYWFSTLLNITFEVNNFLWLDCYHYLILLTLRNVHTFAQHYQNHMIERHLHHTTTSTSITSTVHQQLLSYHRHLPYSKCVQIKLLHINPATILYLISLHIYVWNMRRMFICSYDVHMYHKGQGGPPYMMCHKALRRSEAGGPLYLLFSSLGLFPFRWG